MSNLTLEIIDGYEKWLDSWCKSPAAMENMKDICTAARSWVEHRESLSAIIWSEVQSLREEIKRLEATNVRNVIDVQTILDREMTAEEENTALRVEVERLKLFAADTELDNAALRDKLEKT